MHDARQASADIYGRSCQRVPAEGDSEATRRQKKKRFLTSWRSDVPLCGAGVKLLSLLYAVLFNTLCLVEIVLQLIEFSALRAVDFMLLKRIFFLLTTTPAAAAASATPAEPPL